MKKVSLLIGISVVLSFILFGNSLKGGYTLDDYPVIDDREVLESIKSFPEIFTSTWHSQQPWTGTYRPLTLASFALNNFIFSEDNTFAFHLINILLHAFNVVLIFYVVSQFTSKRTAYLSALLFMFMPIHSEPISSIVGRKELLGLFFILLSLHWFFRKRYFISSTAFLFALLANEFSISLLPLIGILLLIRTESFSKPIKPALFYLSPLLGYFLLRYLALKQYVFSSGFVNPIIQPLVFLSTKERIFTALSHFYLYMQKSFYPINLSPDYSFNQIPVVKNIFYSYQALSGLLILIGLTLLFIFSKKELKIILALFLTPYIVMSNIFLTTTGTFAERWWYFPSSGLSVLIAFGMDRVINNYKSFRPYLCGFGVVVLIWYSFLTIRQNEIWLNNRSLIVYTVKASPDSARARANLAAVYFKEHKLEEAKNEIDRSLKISGDYPFTLNIYAKLKWQEGEFEEAERAFRRAVENDITKTNHRDLYRALAVMKLETKNYSEALIYIRQATESFVSRNMEKTVYLDNLLLDYIDSLSKNKQNVLSNSEKEIVKALVIHIKGSE